MMILVPALLGFGVRVVCIFGHASPAWYFSIITQALTYALMLAFFRNDMGLAATMDSPISRTF